MKSSLDIKEQIKEIKRLKDDDETAHALEDELREQVLERIASGEWSKKMCVSMAKEALKTREIEFARWCA